MATFDRLIAEIQLNAIASNWKRLNDLSGHADTAAVVKADAYGHGATEVSAALFKAGCRVFFTASAEEAAIIRPYVKDATIGYFDGLFAGDLDTIRDYNLTPSINDPQQLDLLPQLAHATGTSNIMLQLDTGMNRLGIDWSWLNADTADKIRQNANCKLIYSHLSSADEPENELSSIQLQRFTQAKQMMPDCPASLAASGGILRGNEYHLDMVRPGIALYGYPPIPAKGFTPALTLKARVLQIRHAKAGEYVGYNATHKLSRDTVLATIAGGYADGIRRQISNKGHVYYNSFTAPILGRVSMDSHVIDITNWPEGMLGALDYVTIISPNRDANVMALLSDTICYDVLTSLRLRAARSFVR